MIAADFPEKIRQQLANSVDISATEDGFSIYLPFVFDDGDPCGFSLGRSANGAWVLSDEGDTITRASYVGPDLLTKGYTERLHKITSFYGIEEERGELTLSVDEDNFSEAIYTFTQACLEVVNLAKTPRQKTTEKSNFAQKLGKIIERSLPSDILTPRWHHPEHDSERIHTVDYHIQGQSREWYLFGIPTQHSAMRATIACYHYKKANVDFESIAIYDKEESMSTKDTIPLNEIVDRHFPRIAERKTIVEFLEETVR